MKKTHICIHHTAIESKDDGEQFDLVDRIHKDRWEGKTRSSMGFYGGYHYILERSGSVQQFREDWEVGAHNNKGIKFIGGWWYSENYYSIGISFAGNMSLQNLTDAQVVSAVNLIKELKNKHSIPDENIRPHRATSATQCPGTNLPDKTWKHLLDKFEENNDWKKEAQSWAVKKKVSNGERPNDPVTRVEVWQMLRNFYNI